MRKLLNYMIPRSRVRLMLLALAALLAGGALGGLFLVRHLARDLPSPARIQSIEPTRKTLIFAANGDTIREFYTENRTVVPLSRMPVRLQQAFIDTEDRDFYDHYGIAPRRIFKVIWTNLTSRRRPGASTLTQQLARNLFLTQEKTVSRKLKEIILALRLEQTYTKDEILEMYLNEVPFGRGIYGVQEASRQFFGKDVWSTEPAEMTLLAGIPNRPGSYNPQRHLDRSYRRRLAVLESMVAAGHMSRDEARRTADTEVVIVDAELARREAGFAAYFVEEVRQELEQRYGYAGLYRDGLRVTTTLVPVWQRRLEAVLEEHLTNVEAEMEYPMTRALYDSLTAAEERPEKLEYLQGAGVLLDARTGAVLAMTGGRSFTDSKWNRATQAPRQPGSIFKPVVYLTALEHGYRTSSILLDSPVVIDTGVSLWRPKNFNNRFMGPMTLRYGLSHSKNVVTAKLVNDFGVSPLLETARQLGIASPLPPVHSLALGAGEVRLIEMVAAYASFGNHGVRAEPYLITRVETDTGEILEETRIRQREVLDPGLAYMMTDLMHSTLVDGTARYASSWGFRGTGAGKTGTTNDNTDAWFVGFTPSHAAGVWVGFDEKLSMGLRGTGAHMAMPIWAQLMAQVAVGRPDEPFVRPEGIVERRVCLRSGMLATANCDSTAVEIFLADNTPPRPCDLHGGPLADFEGLNKDFGTLDDGEDEF